MIGISLPRGGLDRRGASGGGLGLIYIRMGRRRGGGEREEETYKTLVVCITKVKTWGRMIRFDDVPPEIIQAMCTPMHQILLPPPAQHLGHLWLGSFAAISDNDLLRKHRISHIVQVVEAPWLPPVNDPNMTVTRIDIMDTPSADLKSHLDDTCARIEKSLGSGKNVLVHCQQVHISYPTLFDTLLHLSQGHLS